jgi:glycerophosphoryl diester phosphodiesterase
LKYLRQQDPTILIGVLLETHSLDLNDLVEKFNPYSVHIDDDIADEAFIYEAKKYDLNTLVYTVDEPSRMLQLQHWGVEDIFTNDPELAIKTLAKKTYS